MRKLSRFIGVACFGVLIMPLFLSSAQEQPAKRANPFEELDTRLAIGMVEGIRSKLPAQAPKDIVKSLVVWREVNNYLQSGGNYFMFLLVHKDPAVRREAALTLAELSRTSDHASSAVGQLTKMLNDRDVEVRLAALQGLARMAPHSKAAVPKVLVALNDDDPRIRRKAILVVGGLVPEEKDLVPVVISALDDSDVGDIKLGPGYNSVSMLAMIALGRCKGAAKDAVPKLVKIFNSDKNDESYRSVAMRTLIAINPEHRLPLTIARECLKRKDNPTELSKGAITLTFLGPHAKEAIPDLIAVLKMPPLADAEEERKLKSNVLAAFGAMGAAAKEVLPLLRSMLPTEDSNLRAYINQAIKNIERPV